MKKFYMNIELDIEKLIFKYKQQVVLIINTKKETCPAKNISRK